ncbi:unnamed protein product [Moneuplotes crassus]|uniref:Mei2-like C-terminal RNA recognition motif domain-containing protein n=1 Tax=Euplotes crassus TaxID=5936 RepID=A0AAD1XHK0_EUPCR|nr:unnamed protein product [Moneuplotes crassus]
MKDRFVEEEKDTEEYTLDWSKIGLTHFDTFDDKENGLSNSFEEEFVTEHHFWKQTGAKGSNFCIGGIPVKEEEDTWAPPKFSKYSFLSNEDTRNMQIQREGSNNETKKQQALFTQLETPTPKPKTPFANSSILNIPSQKPTHFQPHPKPAPITSKPPLKTSKSYSQPQPLPRSLPSSTPPQDKNLAPKPINSLSKLKNQLQKPLVLSKPSHNPRYPHTGPKKHSTAPRPKFPPKKPKNAKNNYKDCRISLKAIRSGTDTRSSIMLKNIPNKYDQKSLLKELDLTTENKIDFFYLPIDFKNHCNKGFAVINFREYTDIIDFYEEWEGRQWGKFNSKKIAALAYFTKQNKDELASHFLKTPVAGERSSKVKALVWE